MKKISKIVLTGIFIFLSSFAPALAAGSALSLDFAENCQSRDGCTFFTEQGDKFVKNGTLNKGERVVVDIAIRNPEKKSINSVSSWIKYNPAAFKALSIEDRDSDFDFPAPDGNKINEKDGLVQIGRAKIGGNLNTEEIFVGSVIFEVLAEQKSAETLEFFNYQTSELGNTGVFTINGLLTDNILTTAPKKLQISLNGGAQGDTSVPTTSTEIPTEGIGGPDAVSPLVSADGRPQGLRVKSGDEAIELRWQADPKATGYFVYYSTKSGTYLFRRDVGKADHAVINNLHNDQKYFLAITAYDGRLMETDYSDEVYATPGVSGSESHPFLSGNAVAGESLIDPTRGTTDDTGPRHLVFLALAAAFVLPLLVRFRRVFV